MYSLATRLFQEPLLSHVFVDNESLLFKHLQTYFVLLVSSWSKLPDIVL